MKRITAIVEHGATGEIRLAWPLVILAIAALTVGGAAAPILAQEPNTKSSIPAEIREIRGKHLIVHTDVPDRPDVDELTKVFDQAIPQWSKFFGLDESVLQDWQLRASVMVDPRRFEQAGLFPADLPSFLAGYQRGTDIWVYIQPGDYYTRHLVLHEGTHALMNQFVGGLGAPWYAEGMAELVGLNQWREGQLVLAHRVSDREEVPYWGRVALLRKAVEAGQPRTLDEVLAIPAAAFRQVESYAWAWAACEFLSRHPISAGAFAELVQHCPEDALTFNRRLTESLPEQWPRLEFEWKLFLTEVDYGYDVERAAITEAAIAEDGQPNAFTIAADRGWQQLPLELTAGQRITIAADGEFQVGQDTVAWPCRANGITLEYYQGRPLGRLIAAILPSDSSGAAAATFPRELAVIDVGSGATILPETSGRLLLRVNDSPARWRDNRGTLRVRVE